MFLDLASAIAEISANIATLLGPLNGFSFEWKYGIDVIFPLLPREKIMRLGLIMWQEPCKQGGADL